MVSLAVHKRVFIYTLPIIVYAIFLFGFASLFTHEKEQTLENMFQENVRLVQFWDKTTKERMIQDPNFEPITSIADIAINMDMRWQTFSAVYDTNLALKTPRNVEQEYYAKSFSPLDYPEFHSAIAEREFGRMTLQFGDKKMRMFFQWIPSCKAGHKYVWTVGIMETEITDSRIWYVIMTFVFVVVAIFFDVLQFRRHLLSKNYREQPFLKQE